MSGGGAPPVHRWSARARGVVARRIREREFWNTQIAVALITALHVIVEAGDLHELLGHAGESLHHVPVVLYLLPVAYASLVYGLEGAMFTSAWAGLLALINVPLWHSEAFDWVFEMVFILLVMAVGAVTARPVELERAQRFRAERSARRLTILNELAGSELSGQEDLTSSFRSLATQLRDELDLVGVEVVLHRGESSRAFVDVAATSPVRDGSSAGTPLVVDIQSASMSGRATLTPRSGAGLTSEDEEFATTAVRQLSVRGDNAALAAQERATMETYVRLVTSAQEAERKRISLDLHDGPAQELALLVRELDKPAWGGAQSGLRERASAILDEVRRVARRQRPSALDVLGLRAALESTLEDLESGQTSVEFHASGPERRLPSEVEEGLYRIVQEAVRNAVRHSGGELVSVKLDFDSAGLSLRIEDDGRGFEPSGGLGALVRSGRMGVMGMAERAQLIEADFEIGLRDAGGTSIAVRWREPGT